MTHGADDGEAISCTGHVEIAEKDIEGLGADVLESFLDRCGLRHVKAMFS